MMLEHKEAVIGTDLLDLLLSAAAISRVALSVIMVIRSSGFSRRQPRSRCGRPGSAPGQLDGDKRGRA